MPLTKLVQEKQATNNLACFKRNCLFNIEYNFLEYRLNDRSDDIKINDYIQLTLIQIAISKDCKSLLKLITMQFYPAMRHTQSSSRYYIKTHFFSPG